ncbi:MAG: TIGR02300 family protein [Pseudomonadota bacterium]|nr:TIGR02300 family protein [Pseudomonadota bacterium]
MAKAAWGEKRICEDCGTKFYDLRKDPIICPKCGSEFTKPSLVISSRTKTADAKKSVAPEVQNVEAKDKDVPNETGETEFDLIDSDDDELEAETSQIIEDTSDLSDENDKSVQVAEDVNENFNSDGV